MQAHHGSRDLHAFGLMLTNVPCWVDPSIAIAASRCGAIGVLNCEGISDPVQARQALDRVRRYARGRIGLKLEVDGPWTVGLLEGSAKLDSVVLIAGDAGAKELAVAVKLARACAEQVLVEVTSEEQASRAASLSIQGLIAKGQEAGGFIGEETTLILLQRLLSRFSSPVWAHGGVGLHSAAACFVGGAAECSPTPPCAHTGEENRLNRRWRRISVVSSPMKPPASCPLAIKPWMESEAAREACSSLVTSTRTCSAHARASLTATANSLAPASPAIRTTESSLADPSNKPTVQGPSTSSLSPMRPRA